jgi:hypothetical protein
MHSPLAGLLQNMGFPSSLTSPFKEPATKKEQMIDRNLRELQSALCAPEVCKTTPISNREMGAD